MTTKEFYIINNGGHCVSPDFTTYDAALDHFKYHRGYHTDAVSSYKIVEKTIIIQNREIVLDKNY